MAILQALVGFLGLSLEFVSVLDLEHYVYFEIEKM